MTKKILRAAGLALLMLAIATAGAFGQAGGKKLKIAFAFPGLINNGSFNKLAYAALEKAKKDLGAETAYVESVEVPDAPKVLRDYASKGFDVVVAWSGAFPSAVSQVAPDFPKVTFVTLSDPGDYPKNVWLVGTDFEDVYFLSGAAAALSSKTGKLGHVLAIPIPVYAAGAKSFAAGAKYINPKAEVFETFIGDFDDVVKATQTAAAQIEEGADVIQSSLDLGELGVINAAKAAGGVKVLGTMTDLHDASIPFYLGSILQDYPTALVGIFKQVAKGKTGGFQSMGLGSKLGRLSDLHGLVSKEAEAKLADLQKKLIAGQISYPTPKDLK